MIFLDEHEMSLLPKCLIMSALGFAILISGWLMFGDSKGIWCPLQPFPIRGDLLRRGLLWACAGIYFIRLLFTLFMFFKRKLSWIEAITISVLMAPLLFAFMVVGGNSQEPLGILDLFGALLYILGSFLNTWAEHSRHVWRKKPENRGRLYTQGLFKYAMHINYLGDSLLFTGFAVITHEPAMLLIPCFMTLNFVVILIPSLDRHLARKYGKEFDDYAARTNKLVPKLY